MLRLGARQATTTWCPCPMLAKLSAVVAFWSGVPAFGATAGVSDLDRVLDAVQELAVGGVRLWRASAGAAVNAERARRYGCW